MNQEKDYLQDLTEIRSMMERSSRFISLSGLSGVFAGIFALLGSAAAYFQLKSFYLNVWRDKEVSAYGWLQSQIYQLEINLFFTALIVLLLSLAVGYYFTARKAKRTGHKVWNKSSRQLLINVSLPLIAGGIFCLALYHHGLVGMMAPATLVFYGLALINGSKYTLDDIRYLGYLEIALGLISSFAIGYGLWFWAFGFGILHIVYGVSMYFKYEHKK